MQLDFFAYLSAESQSQSLCIIELVGTGNGEHHFISEVRRKVEGGERALDLGGGDWRSRSQNQALVPAL